MPSLQLCQLPRVKVGWETCGVQSVRLIACLRAYNVCISYALNLKYIYMMYITSWEEEMGKRLWCPWTYKLVVQ